MALITNVTFNGSRAETTGGTETLTTFGSPSESFGTDATGNYWSWTSTGNPGAGITLDSELTDNSVYSIALRFKFSGVTGYRKIVDYSNGLNDTGFYILDGKVSFYPLGTATAPTFASNQLIDLIATRDASNIFRVYVNDGSGGYTKVLEVTDTLGRAKPPLVSGKYRFGFFYDDTATRTEYSTSGQVYSIKAYDNALSVSDVASVFPALDTAPPTLSSPIPADDATNVAIGANIVLNFSETVVAGSGNIVIKKSDGTTVATIAVSDPQVSISGSTVTINPTSDLLYSTSYYVEIASGVFKDSANNNYAGISGSTTLNFTTAAAPASPSSGGSSDPGPSRPTAARVDTTPTDPAPAGTNIQPTDADGDGLREVITASDGTTVDGNRDGIPDVQQTEVAGLRLINDGGKGTDYGALVVSPEVRLSAVTLTSPTEDDSIPVTARGGGTVVTTTPDGITNAFAGVVSFNVSGVTPGGSTEATISFPAGLPADSGNAYVRFNYSTNRFEEYVDASGARLYSFVDNDGDGVFDAVKLTLVDGDPNWDGDGSANGTVVDPGFLAVGERDFSGTKRKDTLTGNILANTINGGKSNDWLQGGLGADVLIGGKGKDRYAYTSADESTASARDTVRLGKGDRFVFSSFDGDITTEGQQKLSFIGKQAFSGIAGELRATRSLLEADINGDSLADFAVNLRRNFLITERNLVL